MKEEDCNNFIYFIPKHVKCPYKEWKGSPPFNGLIRIGKISRKEEEYFNGKWHPFTERKDVKSYSEDIQWEELPDIIFTNKNKDIHYNKEIKIKIEEMKEKEIKIKYIKNLLVDLSMIILIITIFYVLLKLYR